MTSQLQVLNKILQTKDYSIVTLNNLTVDYFYNYKDEFNYIKNHYNKYHTVPDRLTFVNVFPDFDVVDVSEPDTYLLEQLNLDYNRSFIATNFNEIKKMIEKNEVEKAVDFLTKSIDNLHRGAPVSCTDIIADHSRYDRYIERTADRSKFYVSTGFPELDNITGGIDLKNENMVIAARTGQGKTQTLLFMAANAAVQGLTVGIYEGEMVTDKVAYRIDTFLGRINNTGLNRGDASINNQYKNYLNALDQHGYGAIKVMTPADIGGPATVNTLRAFIEREHLDILFVDQYSLLEDTSHSKSTWEKVSNISKEIKNLQVLKEIPIISVAQMNRTKEDDDVLDTTQIGLADRIGQDATVVLMLERRKKDNVFVMRVVKARDGGDNRELKYNVDFNYGTFTYIPENQTEEEAQQTYDSYEIEPTGGNGVF